MTEKKSQEQLDWDSDQFVHAIDKTAAYLAEYVEQVDAVPVANLRPMQENQLELKAQELIESGALAESGLASFITTYLKHSTQLHHPNYMAHQVASPAIPSSVAELIHGSINNPGAIYEMGSTAASLEHVVLNWMLEKLSWKPEPLHKSIENHGAGALMNGGSLANLVALLAARSHIAPDAWECGNPKNLKVLAPANSHYSIERALSIMGLGRQALVSVEVDDNERMIPCALNEAIEQTQAVGDRVMAVVANACATGSGLFDPLREVANVCQKHQVWLHVDACHGASFLISNKLKHLLDGAEKADSFVWDAHKMMRVSGLCTAVLVKNSVHLQNAFKQQASYLFYGSPSMGKDYLHRTVECTKTALGTKLFLTLAWKGKQAIAEYIENRVSMAKKAHEIIAAKNNFKGPYVPESNILCFRYKDDDELQVEIRESLLNSGKYHLTSTQFNGKRYLRITIMTSATNEETIEGMAAEIARQW